MLYLAQLHGRLPDQGTQPTSCDHLLVDTQEELSYTHPINKGHLIKPT
jgi:hypothetical protein